LPYSLLPRILHCIPAGAAIADGIRVFFYAE